MEVDVNVGGCGCMQLVLLSRFQIQGFKDLDVILAWAGCNLVSCHMFASKSHLSELMSSVTKFDIIMTNPAWPVV